MYAEVIQDACGVEWVAGDVGLGQLAPEPRVLDQLGCGRVVGVGILPEGGEDKTRPDLAEYGRKGAAIEETGFQASIGQAEVLPPGTADARSAAAVSAVRRSRLPSGVGSPLVRSRMPSFQPCWMSRTIVPPMPSSPSSGCGATTKASSMSQSARRTDLLEERDRPSNVGSDAGGNKGLQGSRRPWDRARLRS